MSGAAYAIGPIDPTATEEAARWVVEQTVRELLTRVPDPRRGEITISYFDGLPGQVRDYWAPDRKKWEPERP